MTQQLPIVLPEPKLTSKDIQKLLTEKYGQNSRYAVPNIYVFRYDWETDFFVQKENGYSYEFEIKISRSDFFADFKKTTKHEILKTGKASPKSEFEKERQILRPNRMFYVTPFDLIKPEEVPQYAGLMYASQSYIKTVKNAPLIHKEILNLEIPLCRKFYFYWKEQLVENKLLEIEIKKLKDQLKDTPDI